MKFVTLKQQQGIGLIEVMIALLILAVAILGFSAMQMSAIRTTDESVMRSRAMTVMRGGAEIMRSNAEAIAPFMQRLNTLQGAGKVSGVGNKCVTNACTAAQLAERDAEILHNYANDNEIRINVLNCPVVGGNAGNSLKRCMIASWGETTATFAGDANACADANGTIQARANCFVVEAY